MQVNWQGVYPALTTPFTDSDTLDQQWFEKNITDQLAAGVDGLIIGGSLGEASVLTLTEKEKLVKTALKLVKGRVPVILNIAEGSTSEAKDQVALAAQWGADGLMLLPPMRYKSDARETVQYFTTLALHTELPIMIYNNPVDYKIEVTPDMFEELLTCSNIQAVKESTRDVTNVTRLVNRFGDRLKILCGVDTLAMEEMLLGAGGWVAGLVCAFPRETVAIYRLIRAGRLAEARSIYRWFMPLLELDIRPKLVQYIKLAQQEAGMGTEWVRPPRLILEGHEREQVTGIIRKALAKRPQLPDYDRL